MSDLVERLRQEPYPYEKQHGLGITAMEVWHKTACEAAEEIERLQSELNTYRTDNEELLHKIKRLRAALKEIAHPDCMDEQRIAREALRDE